MAMREKFKSQRDDRRLSGRKPEEANLTPWREPGGLARRGRWLSLRSCWQPTPRLCSTLPQEGVLRSAGVDATCADTAAAMESLILRRS